MLWRAVFWVSFPFGILSFVLPIYGKELGATALEVGGLFSALAFVPVVVRPFLGRALDRWGRKPFLLLGLLGYAAAIILFCLADTVWLLTVAYFLGAAIGPLAGGCTITWATRCPFTSTPLSCSWARRWWRGCCASHVPLTMEPFLRDRFVV